MADEAATTTDAADESTVDSVTDTTAKVESTEGETALGDAGKKALDAMKAARNEAKAEAKAVADELAALKAQVEGKQAEFEAEKKAREIETAALDKVNARLIEAEVRARAAGKLNDPADAIKFLDLSKFEVGDDFAVDGPAVADAIAELIKNKPYLAAQGKRFEGDADGGTRKESGTTQLTRDDLDRMTPDEIVTARKDGRLNKLMGTTS